MRLPRFVMERLRDKAIRIARSRPHDFLIGTPERPYLYRWWVIPRNRWFNIYLHQVVRSDDDRALHDHPWVNASIVLSGYYIEHGIARGGIRIREIRFAGDVKLRFARAAHRLEIGAVDCWTFFITGPTIRSWGFHCPEAGWRHWRDFVEDGGYGVTGRGCGEMGDAPRHLRRRTWPWSPASQRERFE